MKDPTYYERVWLNTEKEGGMASIVANNDSFKIADCNRIITLSFEIDQYCSTADLNNIETKVEILFNSVKKYRQYIKKKLKYIKKKKKDEQE